MISAAHTRSLVHLLALAALALVALGLALAPRADAAFAGRNGDIAYGRLFEGAYHVFKQDPVSGRSTQLSTDALAGAGRDTIATEPSFGPTGKRIVFLNYVKTGHIGGRRPDVFVMRADGSHVKRLTHSPGREYAPAFSADGKQIAYSLHGKTYVIASNGKGGRVELTAELPDGGVGATFSSDGSKVAVTSFSDDDSDIVVMNADGSDPVNVTAASDDNEYQADFSPDGSRIAFISTRLDSYGDLFTMAADGTDVVTVEAAEGLEAEAPVYSPDGEQIAYETRLSERGAVRVATIPAAGGEPESLPNSGAISSDPSWGIK